MELVMYDAVVAYLEFGAGDIFEAREFIKDIINIIPAKKYHVAHGKDPRILQDLGLEFIPINDYMPANRAYNIVNNDCYINFWIGRDSKYVLPNIGCVVEKNYEMFNDTLKPLGYRLSKDVYDYLPVIDYSYFNTKHIDNFVSKDNRKKVLICNGPVHSNQAANFDMESPIRILAGSMRDTLFLVTQEMDTNGYTNIISTKEVIKSEGFDLNEIAYLAMYCDTVIGRKSGPFVFAHTKDFWYSNKKSLSFTYGKQASHFVLSDHLPLRKYWSNVTDLEGVYNKMKEVINV